VLPPVVVAPSSIDALPCESDVTANGGGGSDLCVRVGVFEYCTEDSSELFLRGDYVRLLERGRMNGAWHAKWTVGDHVENRHRRW
jgi:hypothetical protein